MNSFLIGLAIGLLTVMATLSCLLTGNPVKVWGYCYRGALRGFKAFFCGGCNDA